GGRPDLWDDGGRSPRHAVRRVRGRDRVLLLRGLRGEVRGPARPRRMTATDELSRIAPDVETVAQRLAAVDYLVDEGLATSLFLCLRLPQPLLLEGEARGWEAGGVRARQAAGAAAVLRGDRRVGGAVRVELSAPAPEHQTRGVARLAACRGGAVRARVPDPPPAPPRARASRAAPRRAA